MAIDAIARGVALSLLDSLSLGENTPIVQTTGDSEAQVMSQKAVTAALNNALKAAGVINITTKIKYSDIYDENSKYRALIVTYANGEEIELNIGKVCKPIKSIMFDKSNNGEITFIIAYDDYTTQSAKLPIKDCGITSLEQTMGNSETAVMSQKVITTELNNRANALKGNVRSSYVANMNDVSPDNTKVSVRLSSKNLIPYPFNITNVVNGITFTNNGDGTVTANGTANYQGRDYEALGINETKVNYPAGTYIFSGCPLDGGSGKYVINFYAKDSNGVRIIDTLETGNGLSFNAPNGIGYVGCSLRVYNGQTVENLTYKPQLEEGTVATEYTPYVADGTETQISVFGKNLLSYPYIGGSQKEVIVNGVKFTDNGDGTITANGTATANARYDLRVSSTQPITPLKVGETYTYSGCPKGDSSSTYFLQCYDTEAYKNDTGNGYTFTAKNNKFVALIVISAGTVCNNLTFKPQLERGAKATDYEPFYVKNYTTQVGSNIDIDSIAPIMTIKADNTVLDIKYNKDANKVISMLEERIATLELAVASN